MAKWMVAAKKADFEKIAEKYQITPVLARILRNRELVEDEDIRKFLYGGKEELHEPLLMKDMEKAAEIIGGKIREGKHIRIMGDYDVDGICASYLLQKGIKELGGNVDVIIPHRMKDGYGLNESLVREAYADKVDTILTCDNGIAAAEQIALAKELGMTVVVTDHHEVPYEENGQGRAYLLPPADAVVDPKQEACLYPFKQICGAVIAGKLVKVLWDFEEKRLRSSGKDGLGEEREQGLSEFQDKKQKLEQELFVFGALATVCDVMELRDENRIIVKEGLRLMENTENPGLKALLMVNGISGKPLSPYHAGFIIGPCMNASGRLDTAERVLELLSSREENEAFTLAGDLKNLNDNRKTMTEQNVKAAIEQVENTSLGKDRVFVLYLPDCHESLAGIVAGRIREKYGKPVFVLTKAEEGIKGSGRSIESYSMYEEMSACKDLFTRYGGHKMAAGLSLEDEEKAELFRKRLNESCRLTEEDFEKVLHIDVPMPLAYADKAFVRQLSLLEPFGVGNPRPLFARKGISLLQGRKMGKARNVGKYRIADEYGKCHEMIYFGDMEEFDAFLKERFGEAAVEKLYREGVREGSLVISMVYYPELNTYKGQEKIQIVMQDYC